MVEWDDSTTKAIEFYSRWDNRSLTSTANLDEYGSVITRIVERDPEHSFLYRAILRISNKSDSARRYALRVSTYKPLVLGSRSDKRYEAGFVLAQGKMERIPARLNEPKVYVGTPLWFTSQGKSHTLIVQPENPVGVFHVEPSGTGEITGWLTLPETRLSPGAQTEWRFKLYAGPINLDLLEQAGMEQMISFGMFSGVARFLLKFMDWGYGWLHNYGLSICLLSFAVWLPFMPLTWYGMKISTQTMRKMSAVKPLEAKIRQQHAKNPTKMQQELMRLYKKHGINPASGCLGCLPFLFQWPIFIALFQVLNRAPQLRGAGFLWIKDLSAPDAILRFPITIPLVGDSLNILPIFATAGMFLQQQLMQQSQVGMTPEQRAQQKIFRFFPLFLLVFFYRLPSGFMLYWVIYSVFMAAQQFLIKRGS